ncbi:MAG: GGDEF domain-containing protein [Ruminococcus sp.]|nr:GGDEF domain-containing protein [Ruminococcus sp.]
MKSYKIALIIEEINQSYQSAILDGIAASVNEFSFEVSAFVSFSGAMINPKHDFGELNIFSLPDFKNFDGAILLTNTITHQPVIADILSRIKEAQIPTVMIDNDIEGLYHIGIDNKTAMRKIAEHLISVHKFTRFGYISGPVNNPESADRLSAFLEVLEENNISIDNDRIYYGDFRAHSGKAAVEEFLSQEIDMPEAIICANDVMASSAISRLISKGYSVPGDIAVTGFDNTYNINNYQIELTSVDRPLELSGRLACKALYNHFINHPQDRSTVLSMSARFAESCGCSGKNVMTIGDVKELNYRNYRRFENALDFVSTLNRLSSGLLGCNDFDEYVVKLKEFITELGIEEFYFCLCDNWNSHSSNKSVIDEKNEKIPKNYTNKLLVPIAYKSGKFYDVDMISKNDLIPAVGEKNNSAKGRLYYIIPLHFGERCLGYMVISNSKMSLHNSMFETLCITISNSLENIRKLSVLEYAVDRLGKLYAQDTFSGIYNRNGFVSATSHIYKDCVKKRRNIMLMFIDLDGLKKINDTYGHSVGDTAICNIADALTKSCVSGEIYCRFGGDEFIVFAADYTEADAKKLTADIEMNIKKINDSNENPFVLSASTGYIIDIPEEGEDIFRFVTAADNIMYTQKRKKKLSLHLKNK